jgi:ABC-type antimicrobial peptide transport system permease subunit
MSYLKYVLRTLVFYWRTNLGSIAGVAIATAILAGALGVGDSVKKSLLILVSERIGNTSLAIVGGDRFFKEELADNLHKQLGQYFTNHFAPTDKFFKTSSLLILRCAASNPESGLRANNAQLIGIDSNFWSFSFSGKQLNEPGVDRAFINSQIAQQLGLTQGMELLLRIEKPSLTPAESVLTPNNVPVLSIRVTVDRIISEKDLGDFSLTPSVFSPNNIFVSRKWLAERAGIAGRMNTILVNRQSGLNTKELEVNLKRCLRFEDIGLTWNYISNTDLVELRSERVFLDDNIARTARELDSYRYGVLGYFVNSISANNRETPYSIICGVDKNFSEFSLSQSDILVNDWLAQDLMIGPGDTVKIKYFVPGSLKNLLENEASFRVKAIVPLAGRYSDKTLMPEFPGLANIEDCRDWHLGVDIDLNKIRKKDEEYWKTYRGVPKAFISLEAAQNLWSNRFGTFTGLRFANKSEPAQSGGHALNVIEQQLLSVLSPSDFGLRIDNLSLKAQMVANTPVDFSGLFIGMSFFIIVSALVLTGLFFKFDIEQRLNELATLLSIGFNLAAVKRILIIHGLFISALGGCLGVLFSGVATKLLVFGINKIWGEITGDINLHVAIKTISILEAYVMGFVISMITIWLLSRRLDWSSISALRSVTRVINPEQMKGHFWLGIIFIIIALVTALLGRFVFLEQSVIAFFIAGACILAGLMELLYWLMAMVHRLDVYDGGVNILAIKNCAKRSGRSVAIAAMTACGIFIIIIVSANKKNISEHALGRTSGTGGFKIWMELSVPIVHDLSSDTGRSKVGLDYDTNADVRFVGFRAGQGSEASCLNPGFAGQPRLLGTPYKQLSALGAFSFKDVLNHNQNQASWNLLECDPKSDEIPGVADLSAIYWNMKKKLGDVIEYEDEFGRKFKVRLVGGLDTSVFQGFILISDDVFQYRFPSVNGQKIFIVDSGNLSESKLIADLASNLEDWGPELLLTKDRLFSFMNIENIYLSIFFWLGALGVGIGTSGLGLIVLRNVHERRAEFALMLSVGFPKRTVLKMVVLEHISLFVYGIICAIVAATIATIPAANVANQYVDWSTVGLAICGCCLVGILCVCLATILSTKQDFLSALRNE